VIGRRTTDNTTTNNNHARTFRKNYIRHIPLFVSLFAADRKNATNSLIQRYVLFMYIDANACLRRVIMIPPAFDPSTIFFVEQDCCFFNSTVDQAK
jgi:hypothetical protein